MKSLFSWMATILFFAMLTGCSAPNRNSEQELRQLLLNKYWKSYEANVIEIYENGKKGTAFFKFS